MCKMTTRENLLLRLTIVLGHDRNLYKRKSKVRLLTRLVLKDLRRRQENLNKDKIKIQMVHNSNFTMDQLLPLPYSNNRFGRYLELNNATELTK